jgi:hypothetical protein
MSPAWAQEETEAASWSFDRFEPEMDTLKGNYRFVDGVKGKAIVMDGYTTCVIREADRVPKLGPDFSAEAWIA